MRNKQQMQQFVMALLNDKLPATYFYHNYEHALYVQEQAVAIGRLMHCNDKELELLSAAALWHDAGFIYRYAGHEEESCLLAQKFLPEYGFTALEIDSICGMIMATKLPQSPTNKLEEIIADADLAYLGTPAAPEKSGDLFRELQSLNPSLSAADWNQTQIDFLSSHHYFTQYCKQINEPAKQAYLRNLIDTD